MLWVEVILVVAGVALAAWLIVQVVTGAKRLDRRIEQYWEEGPPADPYSEYAKIKQEELEQMRHASSKPKDKPKERD